MTGSFGPDPGAAQRSVKVAVTNLTVHTWSENDIVARLPNPLTLPGGSGDVLVTAWGHPSNTVPLTQWRGTVTETEVNTAIGTGAQVTITCPVRATGDVHLSRTAPGVAPTLVATNLFFEVPAPCDYTMSGTWSDATNDNVLSGQGQVSVPPIPRIWGNFMTASGAAAYPVTLSGFLAPVVIPTGSVKQTPRPSGTATTKSVTASWSLGKPGPANGIQLGIDYSLSGTRSCVGGIDGTKPVTCTETWNLKPVSGTAPQSKTKS